MKKRLSAQTGLVLPLVLIFLVIMMLLGTAVIRNVSLEEKMAGNMRNRNVAFQGAEQALRFCENSLQLYTTAANGITILPQGPILVGSTSKEYWEVEGNWTNTAVAVEAPRSASEISANVQVLPQRPRCMVEQMGALLKSTQTASEGGKKETFRITARGVGLDGNAVVQLQSYLVM